MAAFATPTLVYDYNDDCVKKNRMSVTRYEDIIRKLYFDGKFNSFESFRESIYSVLSECENITSERIYNISKKTGKIIRDILNYYANKKEFFHRYYIYNGSSREIEILTQSRFVDVIKPGCMFYDGSYHGGRYSIDDFRNPQNLNYLTKFYDDELLTSFSIRKFNLTLEEMNELIGVIGNDYYFEIEGVFTREEDLARHWIKRCEEITDEEILSCIDFEKYGQIMMENLENYDYILITKTGKMILYS
ncbi:MAG: hypothetical protein Q4E53_05410 [Eubacteriales bacterium]|nr:hypothetical protein [Eubacteriales bacterium]